MTNTQQAIITFVNAGLSEETAELFASLAWDAPNWSGCPMLDITKEQRGNLTDLKKRGLLSTQKSDGIHDAFFTDEGKALIKSSALAEHIA